jgi:DNA-binding XRE family transcriptional regulator
MSKTHDKPALSSEQITAHKEIVERARRERLSPDELIDRGEIDELVSQAQFIEVRALCARLRNLRENAGLSLTEFSEQSGLTRAMISRLENGWNLNPTVETLFRYAEALGGGLKLVLDEPAERAKED